jgi:hypothetical protein
MLAEKPENPEPKIHIPKISCRKIQTPKLMLKLLLWNCFQFKSQSNLKMHTRKLKKEIPIQTQ